MTYLGYFGDELFFCCETGSQAKCGCAHLSDLSKFDAGLVYIVSSKPGLHKETSQ